MAQLRDFAQRFEELCAQLFSEMGYNVQRHVRVTPTFYLDFVGQRNEEIQVVADVKLVTENLANLAELRNITSRSKALLSTYTFSPDKLFLILSCQSEVEHINWLMAEFKINIWDRNKLMGEARRFPRAYAALSEFFAQFEPFENLGRDQLRKHRDAVFDSTDYLPDTTVIDEPPPIRGASLCHELDEVPAGKKGAKQFEELIVSIVDYLFGDYLVDPRPQHRLEDRLNILDVVYRVRPGHPFWDTLTRDFRARVMVFEFKNYSQPVQPDQIYSTERYVSASALRPICFLVTRKKPHKHAELAAFGAMREGGKLFVFLDDKDICDMLAVRDAQFRLKKEDADYFENDPTQVLDQKIYDFLGRMPR